jgi:hypothetical protein
MKHEVDGYTTTSADWIRRTSANPDLVGAGANQAEHTVRISAGRFLFLVGLNAFFLLPFLFPTDIYSSVVNTWRYYVASYLCILVGAVLEIGRLRLSIQPAFKTWITLFAAILGWMTARSLIVGEPLQIVFWNGMIYLSLVVMAVLGQSDTTWKTLNNLFIAHTLIGGIYTLQTLSGSEMIQRIDLMTMSGFNILAGSGSNIPASLYAVPFLLYTFPVQPKLGKLAAVLGYVATLTYFIFWQSRIGSVLVIVQLLILTPILWRRRRFALFRLSDGIRAMLILGFIFVILVTGASLGEGLGDRLGYAGSLLSDRWMLGGSVLGTMQDDYRVYEASVFIQQPSWDEWLAGRGVAATWQDARLYEGAVRSMVHIGYLHYILNGGILLLALMLAPLAFGVRALLKARDIPTMASGGLWIQYSAILLGYGFPSASLTWVLMGLAFGKCVARDESFSQPVLADMQRVGPSR